MDQKKIIDAFFKSDQKFQRMYLQPPTSQKNVPQGMDGLDKMLGKMKIETESKSMERLDSYLAERQRNLNL